MSTMTLRVAVAVALCGILATPALTADPVGLGYCDPLFRPRLGVMTVRILLRDASGTAFRRLFDEFVAPAVESDPVNGVWRNFAANVPSWRQQPVAAQVERYRAMFAEGMEVLTHGRYPSVTSQQQTAADWKATLAMIELGRLLPPAELSAMLWAAMAPWLSDAEDTPSVTLQKAGFYVLGIVGSDADAQRLVEFSRTGVNVRSVTGMAYCEAITRGMAEQDALEKLVGILKISDGSGSGPDWLARDCLWYRGPEAGERVLPLLLDDNAPVQARHHAGWIVFHEGNEAMAPRILAALQQAQDPDVLGALLRCLTYSGNRDMVPAVLGVLRERLSRFISSLTEFLGAAGGDEASSYLVELAKSPDATTSRWARIGIARTYARSIPREKAEWAAERAIADRMRAQLEPEEATISCDPEVINRKSKGAWVTCYIELTHEPYHSQPLRYISGPQSIRLGPVAAAADPKYGWVAAPEPHDNDHDGVYEYMAKLDRQHVVSALASADSVTTALTGDLADGKPFGGEVHLTFK
ncbi:MAG: HEAT repeat domain-containing protein [Candidatus Schekmanbacteria bacterium]|nr:HEAT repeat domain-containing protein [Candidatus Schekmanbacteria bacterium]